MRNAKPNYINAREETVEEQPDKIFLRASKTHTPTHSNGQRQFPGHCMANKSI